MLTPPKLTPGDHVAVLSPSFSAPAVAPALHEQAMRRRLRERAAAERIRNNPEILAAFQARRESQGFSLTREEILEARDGARAERDAQIGSWGRDDE